MKQEVAEAKARLAAGCAVSLAANIIETGLGMEVRERPKVLNVSGPVMRRPEDVRRFYNQYEEMLTPFMKSIKLARWVTGSGGGGTAGLKAVLLIVLLQQRRQLPGSSCRPGTTNLYPRFLDSDRGQRNIFKDGRS